jgi:hypothetical protein
VPATPFSRYRDLPVVIVRHETRGVTRSLPIRRRVALPPLQAQLHRFNSFEAIDLLALRFFGREDLFWQLLDANGGRLPDSFLPGELLVVPPLEAATLVERPG